MKLDVFVLGFFLLFFFCLFFFNRTLKTVVGLFLLVFLLRLIQCCAFFSGPAMSSAELKLA